MASKSGRYSLSPLAEKDLEEIWRYTVQTWTVKQAEAYHADILDAFEGLASGLKVGRRADIRKGYFKYLVGSHVIYYRQQDMEIVIIRILHQRMDVSLHL